jgi:hypothetical protein
MDTGSYYRQEGYQQGIIDGKRTGGRISKRYIENMFSTETNHLSHEESVEYKIGWQEGFDDTVNKAMKRAIEKENIFLKYLYE